MTWSTKKADAYSIDRVIADAEDETDVSDLHIIAERLAEHSISPRKSARSSKTALANHEDDQDGAAEDDDAEDDA
jgi:hypothetical protein